MSIEVEPGTRQGARRRAAIRLAWLRQLMPLGALAAALALAGCKDKACLRWTAADQAAYGTTTTTGASSTSGGATDAGADGGGGVGGSSQTSQPTAVCPDRTLAKKLLGNPSCAEAIESVDSEGSVDGDDCCYEVTTASKACSSESSP